MKYIFYDLSWMIDFYMTHPRYAARAVAVLWLCGIRSAGSNLHGLSVDLPIFVLMIRKRLSILVGGQRGRYTYHQPELLYFNVLYLFLLLMKSNECIGKSLTFP